MRPSLSHGEIQAAVDGAVAELGRRVEQLEKRQRRRQQLVSLAEVVSKLGDRIEKIEARSGMGASSNGHAKTGWDGLL